MLRMVARDSRTAVTTPDSAGDERDVGCLDGHIGDGPGQHQLAAKLSRPTVRADQRAHAFEAAGRQPGQIHQHRGGPKLVGRPGTLTG